MSNMVFKTVLSLALLASGTILAGAAPDKRTHNTASYSMVIDSPGAPPRTQGPVGLAQGDTAALTAVMDELAALRREVAATRAEVARLRAGESETAFDRAEPVLLTALTGAVIALAADDDNVRDPEAQAALDSALAAISEIQADIDLL